MKLVGMMPVRNEDWILGLSARVALKWVDVLVLYLHACTDGSHDIAVEIERDYPGRVAIILQDDPKWDEMNHRQDMLAVARQPGATHLAIIDADEVLTANLLPTIRGHIERLRPDNILTLPLYNLRGGVGQYHANGLWGNRIVSVAFADDPALHWAGDTFHRREPQGKPLTMFRPVGQGDGGVMHFWGVSERRLLAKHALYKVTERLRWPEKDVRDIDQVYSMCVNGAIREDPKTWKYAPTQLPWTDAYDSISGGRLNIYRVPWQEAEVRRIVAEHGREKFAELNLFGIA